MFGPDGIRKRHAVSHARLSNPGAFQVCDELRVCEILGVDGQPLQNNFSWFVVSAHATLSNQISLLTQTTRQKNTLNNQRNANPKVVSICFNNKTSSTHKRLSQNHLAIYVRRTK